MSTLVSSSQAAALLLTTALALPAHAQRSLALQDTVITASRVEQSITEVVADVSIIERAQIERLGATTMTQLLASLPGLQTITYADAGRVYIRGADSRMTALYVDGVRIGSDDGLQLGGGVPWELVPVSQIDRIEVLRGPASAVYGSDAMGGVIQIFTRRGDTALTPYVNLGLGSMNQRKLNAGFSGAQDGWDYALGLGTGSSDGYDTRPDLVHTPQTEASTEKTASLRLGYQIAATQRVELVALDSQLDSHYVPWDGGTDYSSTASLSSTALKWKSQWSDTYSTSLTLSRSQVAKQVDVPYDYRTTLQGALFENRLRLGLGTLTAVLEQKKDEFDSKASLYDPAFSGARTQNAVALGYGVSAGLHSLQVNLRSDNDSLFGSHQTGAIAYAYSFAPNWRATVSSGSAFRAPTLEQVYGPYGSLGLAPETNHNTELGVGYNDGVQALKVVGYRNAISNMISSSASLATCEAGFFCYYNVGLATIRGVTLSGSWQLENTDLRASLDWTDPIDDVTGNVLSLRARRAMTLGIDRRLGDWLLTADIQALGERFDDAANTTILPGYALLNLNASKQLDPDWQLVMHVDNAANAQYQQVGAYATPGRTFYAGFRWQPRH